MTYSESQEHAARIRGHICVALAFALAATALGAALFYAPGAGAATITVSPGQSIQTAINNAAAGDTVSVGAGDYTGGITINKAIAVIGQAGAKLHATTAGQGQGVTITSDNCLVSGLYLDSFNVGIGPASIGSMSGFKNGVTVQGNHTYYSQYHIWIGGTNWLVEGNDFERVRWWNGQGDADYGRIFGTGHVVRGNHFYGTNFSNNDLAPASGSDYAHTDCLQYYGSNGEVLKNVTIEGNTFEDFHQGLFLCDEPNATAISGLTILNNLFIGKNYTPPAGSANFTGRPSWGICIGKNSGATGVVLENNTLINVNNFIGLRAAVSGRMTRNIVRGYGAGTAYDPSCSTPSKVSTDNVLFGVAATGQTGWMGADIYKDPVLDSSFKSTAYPLYGWQGTSAPAPTPDPTPTPTPDPTPTPTPTYTTQADLDALAATLRAEIDVERKRVDALENIKAGLRLDAIEGRLKKYPQDTRQFRDRSGVWRNAPSN